MTANASDLERATHVETQEGGYLAHLSEDWEIWGLIDHECSVAGHGLMGVNGSVWDTAGRLLATGSAQLCCVPNGA
ncbi:MAG TPA: hypothetical protein VG053_07175 [Solirubrobacteraceae bacterium]|jgi:hypothetical protein|nr:hypothetical protein [Solirubrobacteraceae bacterium]